jgi:hypothetical protein
VGRITSTASLEYYQLIMFRILSTSWLTSLLIHLSQCSAPLMIVRISERKHFHWRDYILASNEILKIICCRDSLRLGCSEEILHHWVSIVSEGDFDGTIEAMNIPRLKVRIHFHISRWYLTCCSMLVGMSHASS